MASPLGIEDDTLARLIQAAREFHAKEEVVFPDSNPDTSDDDWAMQVLADHAGDLTLRELEDTMSGLGPEYQAELQALSAVGRGDYAVEEWESALEDARDDWSPDTAHRLVANPMIADEWEAGLEQMQAADQ